MKKLLTLIVVAAGAGFLSSCYYDPYSSGYADSYGYSGGGTTFIHTSNDRWLYDSTVRCYYDRTRGAYYDPWLAGYYPGGYCPQPVTNVPHPYGWSGRGACPVPQNVSYRSINGYQNRLSLIKSRNYSWAGNAAVNHSQSNNNWHQARARAAANYRTPQHQVHAQPATNPFQHRGQAAQHQSHGYQGHNQGHGQAQQPNRFGPRTPQAIPQPQPQQQFQPRGYQGGGQQRAGFNQPVATPRAPMQQFRQPQQAAPAAGNGGNNSFQRQQQAVDRVRNYLQNR